MMKSHKLLDHVSDLLKCKNDSALSKTMEISPAAICKMRNGKIPVSASVVICIHEMTGISIVEIKKMAGLK